MNNIEYDQANASSLTSNYNEKLLWDAPSLTLLTPEIKGGGGLGPDGLNSATHS